MIDPLRIQRIAHGLWKRRIPWLPGILYRLNYFLTNCDLPFTVRVGQRVQFRHFGCGTIVHANTVIGDDVWINSHVVIGTNVRSDGPVPLQRIVIGNGVMLGAGAKIIATGSLEIGDRARIGANAVVLQSVPAGATAVGVPARVISSQVPENKEKVKER